MKKITFLLVVACLLGACNNSINQQEQDQKRGSSGKTLEMLVVANPDVYYGETKALVDSLFGRPQECLPQRESMFSIVNIPMSSYKNTDMFRTHRNIIILDVDTANPDKVYMHIDDYAAPQAVFDFAVKNATSLQENLLKYEEVILREFYAAEHRRMFKIFNGMKAYDINKTLESKFGFSLTFPEEYHIAKTAEDFAWVRKETKDFGIGVLIDVLPYDSKAVFDEQHILDRLDTIMKRQVPGSAPDSYMGIERRRDEQGEYLLPIVTRQVEFDSCPYATETRGCWRTYGDFMGGPFVTYTVLSPSEKRVVMLTGYVFCPRNKPTSKRDLLMQVESICRTLKF
ncbi:MAG: DUF4837 family protein [Bacteroidales bacterium]|nr:DUF4837 family protein [Bacteroidales bacterium]